MSANNYSLGQVGDYEIKQLKVFKTVVDCGGFSAAETMLNIGRSTISLHISNLESRLNLTLCKRGRGGFSLTEEGEIIYQMTETLLESLDAFRITVNNLNASLTGRLRIALSDSVSLDPRCRMPELIRHFTDRAPEVTLYTNVASMAKIERTILNDEADVGFIPYHRKLDGLEYIHLYSDNCYIYVAKDHPIAKLSEAEQVAEVDSYPASHAGLKPHEGVSEQISNMNLSAISYFYDTRLALILSGRYIGFLPEEYASEYVNRGEIVAVATKQRHYTLGMAVIYKKTAQPNKPRELFLQVLREQLAVAHDKAEAAPY
ncbi:MAG: LysR family transcriptional regulator [Marinomonas sp.]|jgi:DNA-binding transcriptional LysR family regulator|uniref:DNA-binding transcriptional LysR family regulator n=1 Tax=Marinomonas communis TaxID=28254 RepID=A0A4R6XEM2_9GAMM|nr:LysR family transcriptional regulator [Marinomonas communis]MAF15785.1 LysR family transcriptional regulator [Marinomonas sp.]RUM49846.1 MAG: LysR family transcriptional regulator [Marinomonas sp.]RUM53340.1 MAG: LysR family transcriptional regulator [Marinomonas sp.]TDR14118.1 DNA-binding transcriptional LysR family regulator [Marinomonas communis]|tara:strand:+ start:83 stop:1033 length:951 start_codon:yes stop_codon:yes gene_type:complete